VLAVSVYGDHELAKRVSHTLITNNAEEQSVAQTRSFTSMFVLIQAAANLAAGNSDSLSDLRCVSDYFQPLMGQYEPLIQSLANDSRLERFIFLGSGHNYGLACEAMLKMKEMSLSSSEAFHFMEFRHGPKSVVTPSTLIVGLLSDTAYDQEIKVLKEMQALGATILAIVDTNKGVPADHVIELHSNLPEYYRAVLQLPVLQLLAFYRAYKNGLNPDQPNNLDAVVRL
jgi:glutamine---fructose-6-phosphate transaminase (isomerizing)